MNKIDSDEEILGIGKIGIVKYKKDKKTKEEKALKIVLIKFI